MCQSAPRHPVFLRAARIFKQTKIFKEFVGIYVFLNPPTGVHFATAIVCINYNIGFFSTQSVGTALTVMVKLRGTYAYNFSGQAG